MAAEAPALAREDVDELERLAAIVVDFLEGLERR